MGGGMYTTEIQKQVAVSFETAEEYKTGKKDPGERGGEVTEIGMKVVSSLLATEARSGPATFFSATYPDRLVTKVYLTGGASRSAFLKEMLAEKVRVYVDFRLFRGVDDGRQGRRPVRRFPTQHLRNGVDRPGAAEPGGRRDDPGINVVPGNGKKRKKVDVGSARIALPLVVLAGTIFFHTTVSGRISRLDADIGKANTDIARLKKEIGEVEKLKARKAELQKKVDIISNLQKGRSGPVRYFEALSAARSREMLDRHAGREGRRGHHFRRRRLEQLHDGRQLHDRPRANAASRDVVLGARRADDGGGRETRKVQLDVPDGKLNAPSPGEDTEWR